MKKMKKMMCILTAVAMLFTMTGLSVFAAGEVESPAEDQVVGTQDSDLETSAVDESAVVEAQDIDAAENENAKSVQEDGSNVVVITKPEQIQNVKVLSGFHSVKFEWKKTSGAEGYNIGIKNPKSSTGWSRIALIKDPNTTSFEYKGMKNRKSETFRVMAVKFAGTDSTKTYKDEEGNQYAAGALAVKFNTDGSIQGAATCSPEFTKQAVNKMEIAVTLKKTRTYGGVKLKAGTRVITDGYSAGNYYFDNPKGKRAYVARIAARGAKADYQPNGDYGLESAEFFINGYLNSNKSLKPKNGRVIWVSTYTQHLYMFKEEGGRYVSLNGYNWPVSMGKATTPSPTGNKMIKKRISARHGIKFWSCYSGMNALHGVKGNWGKKLGRLASHGCIRNPKDGAAKIWQNCKKGTRVIVY